MSESYIKVAALRDVAPGKMKCVTVQQQRVLLANVGGKIYAADEMCTHEEASLCLGSLKGELLKCPLHGSRFDLRWNLPANAAARGTKDPPRPVSQLRIRPPRHTRSLSRVRNNRHGFIVCAARFRCVPARRARASWRCGGGR